MRDGEMMLKSQCQNQVGLRPGAETGSFVLSPALVGAWVSRIKIQRQEIQ